MSNDIRDLNKILKGAKGILKSKLNIGISILEIIQNRKNICDNCEKKEHKKFITGKIVDMCSECGCIIDHKIRLKSEKCPLDKW